MPTMDAMDAPIRRSSVAAAILGIAALLAGPRSAGADDGDAAPPAPPAAPAPWVRPYRGVFVPAPSTSETLTGKLRARHCEPWTHVFDVPEDAVALEVTLENDGGNVDLDLGFGDKEPDEWTVSEDGNEFTEHAAIARASESDWKTGPLFVRVDACGNDAKTDADEISFKLTLKLLRLPKPATLAVGTIAEGATAPESAHRAEFVVEVPAGAGSVRFDLVDAERDLDLYVARGKPAPESDDADVVSKSYRIRETLIVGGPGMELNEGDKLFVSVIDAAEYDMPVRFRLAATAGTGPPSDLPAIPKLPLPSTPRERAFASVVEVIAAGSSGTGTLVSENGLVLTAHHIVDDGQKAGDVTIAFDFDPTDETQDLFLARTVKEDKELDLALLRIVSDVWGRPLPKDYRFPHIRPAAEAALHLAEEVYTVGFGDTGGNGSRNPVTVSRGIVAGFEREKAGLRVKTDAQIVSGTSGGAVLDAWFGFVGVPLFSISGSSGKTRLGYFMPLAELPAEWRKAIDGGK